MKHIVRYTVENPADIEDYSTGEYKTAEQAWEKVADKVANIFLGGCIVERVTDPEGELDWAFVETAYIHECFFLEAISEKFYDDDNAVEYWLGDMDRNDPNLREFFESAERVKAIADQYDLHTDGESDHMIHDACAGKNGLLNEPAFFAMAFPADTDEIFENKYIQELEREAMEDANLPDEEDPDARFNYLASIAYV